MNLQNYFTSDEREREINQFADCYHNKRLHESLDELMLMNGSTG